MSALKSYSSAAVMAVYGPIVMDGEADGTFLEVEPDSNDYELYVGSKGEGSRSQTNNRSATIRVTVAQTADCNDLLSALREVGLRTGQDVFPFIARDGSGRAVYTAHKCWIEKPPVAAYSRGIEVRVWTFRTHELVANFGGN